MRDVLEAIVTHRERSIAPRSTRSSATPSCSGSTPDRTTTSPRASSCFGARRTRSRRGARRGARRRAFPAARGRNARRAARAAAADVLRSRRSIRRSPARRRRGGKDILTASANNLYVGVTMNDLDGFEETASAELAPRQARRPAGRRGLPRRRPLRRADRRDRAATSRRRFRSRPSRWPNALRALIAFYRTGDDARPRGVRHRVGAGQGVAGRHDQRLRRGLPGRAQHQGRVGGARLLRQPREDVADPDDRRARAVVRGSHAVGSEIPQGRRPRRHRQRHRRRHRNRRVGADHAGRHQPAERSGGSASATAASRCRCRT